MSDSIEDILSTLVFKVAEHFGFQTQDALAAVAQSKVADELCMHGNEENLNIDQICQKLYREISLAE